MRIGRSLFQSKVGRRIFILFVMCALIPILCLSVISYIQVSVQLKKQNARDLQDAAKVHGMAIYERLLYLERDMQLRLLKSDHSDAFTKKFLPHFNAMGLIDSAGQTERLFGQFPAFSDAFLKKAASVSQENTALIFENNDNEKAAPAKAYMIMKADNTGTLVGEIDTLYLWGIGHQNILPPMTDLCITDQYRKVLVSSFPLTEELRRHLARDTENDQVRLLEYNDQGENYFVSYWSMFLKSNFDAPVLNVLLRNRQKEALSALAQFKIIFPLVILLTVWIVLLLSIVHIRKSLVPLEEIKKGTQRVARQDFNTPVEVTSDDEFEEVAQSFNIMAEQLKRQFEDLNTRSKIDREILSSLNTPQIINTALKRMFLFFECHSVTLCLAVEKKPETFHGFILTDLKRRKPDEIFFDLSKTDLEELAKIEEHYIVSDQGLVRRIAAKAGVAIDEYLVVLPMMIDEKLKGIITLGYEQEKSFLNNELKHARQITNQITVALSNSFLVEEMERLNVGTLEALARTVDAKSAWTAGHSERVTTLAMKIAGAMNMEQQEMDNLRRAAYLHDIGKIGIPLSILDKPGRLTDEEYDIIKDHPSIGAKILEPIHAYAETIPIVHQHHEKFDGTGYPGRLAGEDICIGARILAVADVYDAVVSDRPYRNGWLKEKSIKMITDNSGTHFDPKVVDLFLAAISDLGLT